MKKMVQAGFVLGMIFLYVTTSGQSIESGSERVKNKITQKTTLDILINGVGTNLNYGKSNSGLADYKKPALGIQAGLSLQVGLSSDFSIISELYFMMRGGKLKANNPLTNTESTLRFYSVELPVLARFHFGKFHLNAGPSLAYNFDGTRKIEDMTSDLTFKNSVGGFKRFDAGIQMGGGYSFRVSQKIVTVDLRYCYGMTNISYDKEVYNRNMLISLHFSKA